MTTRHVCAALLLPLLYFWSPIASAQLSGPPYRITDLGSFVPIAINGAGQIAGLDRDGASGAEKAAIYSGGVVQYLGTLPGSIRSYATAINNSGEVVGVASFLDRARGFLYSGGVLQDLGSLGGISTVPTGINDNGQVVGSSKSSTSSNDEGNAFLYSGGVMQRLPTLGGKASWAEAINNSGQIVGYSQLGSSNDYRAFLYEAGSIRDLGSLGGGLSQAHAINNSGQVVGEAWVTIHAQINAFLYSDGVMRNIGNPQNADERSWASSINNSGQVVGILSTTPGTIDLSRSFLYENGTLVDLQTRLTDRDKAWKLCCARSINDSGWIIGGALNSLGEMRNVLLTPAVRVAINIKPESVPNIVSLSSDDVVPVAILSSRTFDATKVNQGTIKLAGASVLPLGKGTKYACKIKDVNRDALPDLVCNVDPHQLNAGLGESMVSLVAETLVGETIWGEDTLRIIP